MNDLPSLRRRLVAEDIATPDPLSSFLRRYSWAAVAVSAGSVIAGVVTAPKAPKAAPLKEVDPQEEQRKAIQGNLANQDDIEQLLARGNSFNQAQASDLMEKSVPGYAKIASKFMNTADGLLTNPYQLPDEVASNLTRLAGERGITTGARGQASDYSLLRDFGVNSLQYGQSRINSAQSILQTIAATSPKVNPMSPMSLYVTPNQQIAAASGNNQGQFSAQQGQNNAEAAADNANRALWGGVVGTVAGAAGGYFAGKDSSGIGKKTSYDDFVKNNPASSAATGGTDRVQTDWKF